MTTLPLRRWWLPLLILWLAFGLRLYRLDFQSIWWDEGHSIFVAQQPIPAIPSLPAMDVHPPAYFIGLHLWLNVAGLSEFALRYLSVIFSLLTVALLWRFAAALTRFIIQPSSLPTSPSANLSLPMLPCCPTALLAALSPLYVAYAQEVRSYAMITFLALGSTYSLWNIFQALSIHRQTYRWLPIYMVFTAACLYTHYFTVFLLLFQNLAWWSWIVVSYLTARKMTKRRIIIWIIAQLGILAFFLPQLWLALRQVTGYTNPNLAPPAPGYFISRSWQAYTVGLTLDPFPAQGGMIVVAVIAIISGLLALTRSTRALGQLRGHSSWVVRRWLSVYGFLLSWFVIPLAAYFVVLQGRPSFEPRYLMLVTPALFLWFGLSLGRLALAQPFQEASPSRRLRLPGGFAREWGHITPHASRTTHQGEAFQWAVSRLTPHASRLTFYALFLPLLLILAYSLYSYYTNETYFKDDSAGVATWLAAETTAGDIVYVDVPHPFHYYTERAAIPAPPHYLFVDIHTVAGRLNREATGRDRLYWLTWRGSDTDPRGVIPFLAKKAGQPLGQRDFRGYHVEWFDLPPGATFSLPTTLTPVMVTFGDVLRLDGLAYGQTIEAGQSPWATLHFTLLRSTAVDYRVSLRLRNEAGEVTAQLDRDLLNDRHFRTSAWPPDDPALNQAINVYSLPPVRSGNYQLEVVVYNAQPPYPSEGVTGGQNLDGVAAILAQVKISP